MSATIIILTPPPPPQGEEKRAVLPNMAAEFGVNGVEVYGALPPRDLVVEAFRQILLRYPDEG